jgi:hypothetical protein
MAWTIYRQDVMSGTPCLTQSVTIDRLEHTYWAAIFTAECGFSSAAHLKRLFPFPFRAHMEDVIGRENHDRDCLSVKVAACIATMLDCRLGPISLGVSIESSLSTTT